MAHTISNPTESEALADAKWRSKLHRNVHF